MQYSVIENVACFVFDEPLEMMLTKRMKEFKLDSQRE